MARYIAENGELVENWGLYYTRDYKMVEFKMRAFGDGPVEIALGDERFVLTSFELKHLVNCLTGHLKELDNA